MANLINLSLPEDLRFYPKACLNEGESGGFVERKRALEVWDYVQETVKDKARVGAYLAGPMGVGKSAIMYYVVQKAKSLNWFADAGTESKLGWFCYFFDTVVAGLKSVSSEIQKKYAYCRPPSNYTTWTRANAIENLSLEDLHKRFQLFREEALAENDVAILLAFDESQALFESGENPLSISPFRIIKWPARFKLGCIFVTATADSPYCCALKSVHDRYVLDAGCLTDDEVESWLKTPQCAKLVNHPQFNENFGPEIRSITGKIPRELIILSEEYCQSNIPLHEIIDEYCRKRQAKYSERDQFIATKYHQNVGKYLKALMKFFIQVQVPEVEIPPEFRDTGLAYIDHGFAVPLNMNAVKCFFRLLTESDENMWKNEIFHELKNLESDNPSQVGVAFEKLFGLNMLLSGGNEIILKYYNLAGDQEERIINIRHFITLSADKPKPSWKDYPDGTLVAHSGAGEKRLDFIFFAGEECVLFFEVTVAKDVSEAKYPQINNNSRLDLILSSISKWMGGKIRLSAEKKLLAPHDYPGVVEYIIVSSRTNEDGNLTAGAKKTGEFPWLKIMDRNGLTRFFPRTHIEVLERSVSR
ncbi:hypothetical protein MP638_005907 [Amoeboaphelidium occidentale]|nr:hypothetical protein MP638_005907 [Amoeboaphelidium occidentale]